MKGGSTAGETGREFGSRRSARRKLFEILFALQHRPGADPARITRELLGFARDTDLQNWLDRELSRDRDMTFVIEPGEQTTEVTWVASHESHLDPQDVRTATVDSGPANFTARLAEATKRTTGGLDRFLLDLRRGWDPELAEDADRLTVRISRLHRDGPVTEPFDESNREFIEDLVLWVDENRDRLDEILAEHTGDWSVDRLGTTERVTLQLAVAELLIGETDDRVVINEAVDLTKRFAEEDSHRFVNGVLGSILDDLEKVRELTGSGSSQQDQ